MDFFKSVFSAEEAPDPSHNYPPEEEEEEEDGGSEGEAPTATDSPKPSSSGVSTGIGWSLGGLIKTVASKSESVIQTYRRDLEEFGSGLKKETAAIKEVATRAVRDLPVSLEAGASAAQESLESVGQAIDDLGSTVWRGTAEVISHGKEALLSIDSPDAASDSDPSSQPHAPGRRYTRFEAQVLALQSDPVTFTEDPEDAEDFKKWRSGFELAEKEEEIEILCYENGTVEGFVEKFVPSVVDYDTFWTRYFYKVHKLKLAEDAREKLVRRVISREEDEEDLSWEVDDDEEGDVKKEVETEETEKIEVIKRELVTNSEPTEEDKKPAEVSQFENLQISEATADKAVPSSTGKAETIESNSEELTSKSGDTAMQEGSADDGKSRKGSDIPVVSSQSPMPEEEDLEWDEIEDLGENDEKKEGVSSLSPPVRVDLSKRLSVTEDDEDLSWDIEDDDEPAKP
ncbi:uncharacterized protein [Typha angustifolia]|uniref:uncharacterized protein n=1 Tax=Typha angustifolia TaxID=59011 RepID=UPI003C2CE995